MNELGYFENPEQYSEVGEECFFADSIQAQNYFRQNCEEKGHVFLTNLLFASLNNALLPVWAWVNIKSGTVLKSVSVFKLKDPDFYKSMHLLEYDFMDDSYYFYWGNKLYAALFTSNAEIAVRRVRAILSENNRICVAHLEGFDDVASCEPAKVYDRQDGHFVAVCWALRINGSLWYSAVCTEDKVLLNQLDDENIISYPINIGEKVIIGDHFFICAFHKSVGIYFDITPILATEHDRRQEDILLPKKAEPSRPQLKVFVHEKKAPKQEVHHSKIIAFNFKK